MVKKLILALLLIASIASAETYTYSLASGANSTEALNIQYFDRVLYFGTSSATGNFELTVQVSLDNATWTDLYVSGTVAAVTNASLNLGVYLYARIKVEDKSSATNTVVVIARPFDDNYTFDGLIDVNAGSPSNDNVLTYNSTTSKWDAGAQTALDHDALTNTHNLTSDIDHDAIANYVANEHIDHSAVSVSSGGILSGGGTIALDRTITLASGDVDHDVTANFAAAEHVDHTAVSISSGGILSGGGTIDGNQTITLASGDVDHDTTANFLANEHIDWTSTSENLQTSGTSHFGGASHYTSTEADGTLVFTGNATVWEDLRVPLSSTRLNPGQVKPDFVVFRDSVSAFGFDDGADESVNFISQMPHEWKEGSTIYPHIHWGIATAGSAGGVENVKWGLEYTIANITSDTFDASVTIATDTIDVQNEAQYMSEMTAIGSGIDMTGFTISAIIIGRVFRDTSPANDFAPDAYGFDFDVHYEKDTLGSRAVGVK